MPLRIIAQMVFELPSNTFCLNVATNSAKFDLKVKNYNRLNNFPGSDSVTSADAAGLPIFPGLLKYSEAAAGPITHAIRFTLDHAQNAYTLPATHFGPKNTVTYPPYGTRFRLKASFSETPFQGNQVALNIVQGLKKYGIIFADQGSNMYISGVTDPGWGSGSPSVMDLIQDYIAGSDFEAVQSPNPIVRGFTPSSTPTCNGVSANTNPSWQPTPNPADASCPIYLGLTAPANTPTPAASSPSPSSSSPPTSPPTSKPSSSPTSPPTSSPTSPSTPTSPPSTPTSSTKPTSTSSSAPTSSSTPTSSTKPTSSSSPTSSTKPTSSSSPTSSTPTSSTKPTSSSSPTSSTKPTSSSPPTSSSTPSSSNPTSSSTPTSSSKPSSPNSTSSSSSDGTPTTTTSTTSAPTSGPAGSGTPSSGSATTANASSSVSTGVIAGAVVGGVVAVIAIGALIGFFVWHARAQPPPSRGIPLSTSMASLNPKGTWV